ncbi:MAG: Fe-S cluster assembly protein SufD [Pirellulales bacterium]|jgi:Fe-S cluster assembly protein SufD|nr:Fe-S cluster assembly protein SufD [Thermoguttaceae bacterium]MDD4787786.1 Fe-S cluster assembly protein SufD [Pirellulales bacterium]NLZ01882.1 Fe-S cluster assembly protein SufD [Pirellulaceae bacterium]
MSNLAVPASVSAAGFQEFLDARCEPAWLTDLRHDAWRTFQALPLPDAKSENWRRTDLRRFRFDRFRLPQPDAAGEAGGLTPLLAEGVDLGGQLTALDGRAVEEHLAPKWASRGVVFQTLAAAVAEREPLVKPYLLQRIIASDADKFAALHAACWSGGALLHVPRGVVVDQPFHVLSAMSSGGADFGRIVVVLEEDAEATLLTETASLEKDSVGLHCGAIEIRVGPRARLRFVSLQNWGGGVWHFARQRAVVAGGGHLQWTVGALGAKLAQVEQQVVLAGQDAQAQVNGVMFTEGKQHLVYNTHQHHEQPSCRSDLLYKGALQDRSRLVWRGMIKVDRGAQKTDAYQRNDNLVLSDHARADSIPGLEIEADDVRCSHGATAGRVDDEQVFYAQSRGLTRKEAARMVVNGFFQQVFDRITIESVREALGEAIRRRVREYA